VSSIFFLTVLGRRLRQEGTDRTEHECVRFETTQERVRKHIIVGMEPPLGLRELKAKMSETMLVIEVFKKTDVE
jgi:hypothetical protein